MMPSPGLVSSSKHYTTLQNINFEIDPRGNIKEAGDMGRGCVFCDPLPIPLVV